MLDKVEQQVARIKDKRVAQSSATCARFLNGHVTRARRRSRRACPVDDDLGADDLAADDGASRAPRIVKTKRFGAKPMPPDEAALQMELLGHAFFVFTNTETGPQRCSTGVAAATSASSRRRADLLGSPA